MANYDRFIINLYTTKFQPNYRRLDWNINNSKIIPIKTNKKDDTQQQYRTMEEFQQLTKQRDIECFKLYQATKILQCFDKIFLSWKEKLIAEKVLLESGRTVDLLMSAIRQDRLVKNHTIGTINIGNFKLNLINTKRYTDKTEFFIIMLINDLDVKTTKISRPIYDTLIFTDQFQFKVNDNYQIRMEIYSIELWDLPKFCYFRFLNFNKKTQIGKKNKMLYENIYTHEMVANDIIKTSFKFHGEFILNQNNLTCDKRCFNYKIKSNLNELFSFDCYFDDYKQILMKSGFLTLGQLRDFIVWNRRWCELDGNQLKFYNSPNEFPMVSFLCLNLNNCTDKKIQQATNDECPRKRTIIINFQEDDRFSKIFLKFDNSDDLAGWLEKINFSLELCRN